ncbi:hypothetical protein BGZ97_001240 [Linnemannia gamsii]|uniref:Uncharacterized protein n=1 Tax=Linnemannia gamsii TaxID=64522 RepID=A0A9P6UJK2_9FUNG|nr:hypothetical protein BGZ97_001240 [Linnemannia gamsii]
MGEHHSDTTADAASPPAVSLNKNTSDDDLSSYIGGSLSPSFKAKLMVSDIHSDSYTNAAEDRDVDMAMEGVELEVASLTVQSTTTTTTSTFPQPPQQQLTATMNVVPAVASTSTFFPSEPSLAAAAPTGVETALQREQASPLVDMTTTTTSTPSTATSTSATLTPQVAQSELRKGVDDGNTEAIAPPLGQNESTDQINDRLEKEDDSDDEDSDNDDAQGLDEEPSMIVTTDAIYCAVPISSELHIFPHSSKGFNWNQDQFLKPHQRRNLGVDELHSAFNASVGGIVRSESSSSNSTISIDTTSSNSNSSSSSSNTGGGMSAIRVHEIRLDQDETDQILPSYS